MKASPAKTTMPTRSPFSSSSSVSARAWRARAAIGLHVAGEHRLARRPAPRPRRCRAAWRARRWLPHCGWASAHREEQQPEGAQSPREPTGQHHRDAGGERRPASRSETGLQRGACAAAPQRARPPQRHDRRAAPRATRQLPGLREARLVAEQRGSARRSREHPEQRRAQEQLERARGGTRASRNGWNSSR